MIYIKITTKNADKVLIEGAILGHCKKLLPENELYEIDEDSSMDIDNRVDRKGVTAIMADGTDSTRYEIDYFTDGHWWLKDFSKEKESNLNSNGKEYVFLFLGIVLLLLSIYMFVNDTKFSGFQGPGRLGGPVKPGSVSPLFTFIFGVALLGAYISIAYHKHKKNK